MKCFYITCLCAALRQDERESELRDENFKLHNKYSEVAFVFVLFFDLTPIELCILLCFTILFQFFAYTE